MTPMLECGFQITMKQNVVFACPARRSLLFTETAATILQSTDLAFTASKTLTLDSNSRVELNGGFVKCTSGDITVVLAAA